jgi:N-acetylglucosamine-6-sulfatase
MTIQIRALPRLQPLLWSILMFLASDTLFAAVYPVSQDSYVDARHPYAKYGSQQRIKVTAWAPHTGFGQFDLSGMTSQQTISKAMLRLHVSELRSAGKIGIYLVRDPWNETNINARNQPRIDNQSIASHTLKSGDVGNTVEVDVTAAVRAWQAGRANYGLALRAEPGANIKFDSREKTAGRPMELVVTTQTSDTKPNVVIVLLDDLDTHSLNRMVNKGLMPELKSRIIDKSTNFGNAFVTTSWCCPSRATLLTGMYSHNHNVLTNSRPLGGVHRFDDSSTLATWLQDSGYRTGLVGKYFNNYGNNNDPSTPVDDVGYIPPGWNDWYGLMDQNTEGLRAFQMYNYTINENGALVKYGNTASDYQTDVFARHASQFVDDAESINDQQPFFLVVAPTAPHLEMPGPVMSGCSDSVWNETIRPAPRHIGSLPDSIQLTRPPNFNEADMSDKPAWFRQVPALNGKDIGCLKRQYRDRLNSLRAVDDLVGNLNDALVRNGELDNTVLIFTSDNGFFYGQHRLTDKVLGYEESIRVPLYISAPGFPKQATWRTAINNDLAPTVADFAGITPGLSVDGRSLLPLMRNTSERNWRKRFLVEYLGTVQSSLRPPKVPFSAVRTTNLSQSTPVNQFYMEWHDDLGSKEFYDLSSDRYQISSQHNNSAWASVLNTLAGWLSQLRSCGGGSCQGLENN